MKTAGERAAGLTRQLAAVSRRQALVPKPLSLNEVVRGLRPLFAQLLGADVALEFSLARDAPTVIADPSQLEQVVLNLVVNARDAMPDGGRLAIETHAHSLSGRPADERFDLPPGRYAVLRVSDTGVGMDRETMARIFEPFFTTKSETTGTGLGLATVYGIVKQSGGDVWVYSEPGEGTVFKIYLPEADGEADIETIEATVMPTLAETARSCSSRTTRRSEGSWKPLSPRTGTRSSRRATPSGALAVLDRRPVDLLVTDVVMPGQSGRVLADEVPPARLRRRCCSSRATRVMRSWLAASSEDFAFLSKPFDIEELVMQGAQGAQPRMKAALGRSRSRNAGARLRPNPPSCFHLGYARGVSRHWRRPAHVGMFPGLGSRHMLFAARHRATGTARRERACHRSRSTGSRSTTTCRERASRSC